MTDEKVVVEQQKPRILADRWSVMHRWWSVRISAAGVVLMAGIPALADQYPNIAPSLLAWFPKHGQQWVPIGGALLVIASRIVTQEAIMGKLKSLFGGQNGNS